MRRLQAGFTLTELFITLAVAGVLLAAALPGFTELIRNNRSVSQANEFIYAVKYARSEAIKRGVPVTLCRSTAQDVCDTGVARNWESGWILFAETAGNLGVLDTTATNVAANTVLTTPIQASNGRVYPTGTTLTSAVTAVAEEILLSHEALTGRTTLRGNNNVVNRITFNSQGMAQNSNGTFVLCDSRGNGSPTNVSARADSREIVVAFSGQIRLVTPSSRKATTPVTTDPTTCTP